MTNPITKINGVDIVTAERDGEIFVPIKPICNVIGIAFQSQYVKLQEDVFLAPKKHEMVCLPGFIRNV